MKKTFLCGIIASAVLCLPGCTGNLNQEGKQQNECEGSLVSKAEMALLDAKKQRRQITLLQALDRIKGPLGGA